jgi:hypothetical protein
LVILAVGLDCIVQLLQEFASVAGEEVDAADTTLLQALVGIERLAQSLRVASHEFTLQSFCARGLREQAFELIFDFRAGGLRSVN